MKNILLLIIMASLVLIIITVFAINLWLQMSDVAISFNGKMAIFIGAFFYNTFRFRFNVISILFFTTWI